MKARDKTLDNLSKIYEEIDLLDRLLFKLDNALDSSQPNCAGKLSIKFWVTQSSSDNQEPVVIVRTATRTKYPKKVQEKYLSGKALSRGPFARNYESTKELLKIASELLTYRRKLKEAITIIENKLRGTINGNYGRLMDAESLIIEIDKTVYAKLSEDELEDYHQELGKPIFKVNIN